MPVQHVVRPGECLTMIASHHGFADARVIIDDPANAELVRSRPNPNVLRPGDVVSIPALRVKRIAVATDRKHKVRVKVPRKQLRVALRDHEGQPIANAEYELRVGQELREGTTDDEGLLSERIPLGVDVVELELLGRVLTLRLGRLDPLTNADDSDFVVGLQARLQNLGYDAGPTDGLLGRRTRAALATFQADHGLEIDASPSDATLAKLEEAHGC